MDGPEGENMVRSIKPTGKKEKVGSGNKNRRKECLI